MKWWRYIYFAKCVDRPSPIKIGCSSGPAARVKQLGFDLAAEVSILAQAPGDFTLERNLHHKFRHLRADCPARQDRPNVPGRTEWFTPTDELLAFIERVNRTGRISLPQGERLELIFAARRRAGDTLRAIAADFGISHERVRQVLAEQELKARIAAARKAAA